MKVVRGQAATFVTSCRRPRRGSEAVAATADARGTARSRESRARPANDLRRCEVLYFLFGNKLAEGHGPPELPARSSVRRRTRSTRTTGLKLCEAPHTDEFYTYFVGV